MQKSILFLLAVLLSLTSNLPASTPQMVCAAVGIILIATQPSLFIFPISTISIQLPKLCPSTNGCSYPGINTKRYNTSVSNNKPMEKIIWNAADCRMMPARWLTRLRQIRSPDSPAIESNARSYRSRQPHLADWTAWARIARCAGRRPYIYMVGTATRRQTTAAGGGLNCARLRGPVGKEEGAAGLRRKHL